MTTKDKPINAFHPDFVKTFMPELLKAVKLESIQSANGKLAGATYSKATRENVDVDGSSAVTINKFPKTKKARR